MNASITQVQKNMLAGSAKPCSQSISRPSPRRALIARRVQASSQVSDEGFELMRKGVKVAAEETILTPRCVFLRIRPFSCMCGREVTCSETVHGEMM